MIATKNKLFFLLPVLLLPSIVYSDTKPPNVKHLAEHTFQINHQTYKYVRYLDLDTHRIVSNYVDQYDNIVIPPSTTKGKTSIISNGLESLLNSMNENNSNLVNVIIAFKSHVVDNTKRQSNSFDRVVTAMGEIIVRLDNKKSNNTAVMALENSRSKQREKDNLFRIEHNINIKNQFASRNKWIESSDLKNQLQNDNDFLVLSLSKVDIYRILKSSKNLILGIDLDVKSQISMTSAMKNTNIDPWALNNPWGHLDNLGSGVNVYMSDSGCPFDGSMPNYTDLSGGDFHGHGVNVAKVIRLVSPNSYIYCDSKSHATPPSSSLINGSAVKAINLSIVSVFLSPAYTLAERNWDNFIYDNQVPVFFGAGNASLNEPENYHVNSPGKALNAISVGNYDDETNTINPTSMWKNSEIKNQKPEISAPGTELNLNPENPNAAQSTGTSYSSPFAMGFYANLLSNYPHLEGHAALSKAMILATSNLEISGGEDKVGVGGLNYYAARYLWESSWWSGNPNYQGYSYFANNDNGSDPEMIERNVYLNKNLSRTRIVFAWLNRGDYTWAHRSEWNNPPLGMMGLDFGIYVIDPNGKVVGSSDSLSNPYELIEFDPTVTGNYIVKIYLHSPRDSESRMEAALFINK